jgi:hypothetical protein
MDIEGAFDNLTYTAIEARMIRDRFPLSWPTGTANTSKTDIASRK